MVLDVIDSSAFFTIFLIVFQTQTMLEVKLIKKEKENEMLIDSLKKANRRLGVEYISDTDESDTTLDSDSNSDPVVNTRHYQLDAEFAKIYYFITNVMSSDN